MIYLCLVSLKYRIEKNLPGRLLTSVIPWRLIISFICYEFIYWLPCLIYIKNYKFTGFYGKEIKYFLSKSKNVIYYQTIPKSTFSNANYIQNIYLIPKENTTPHRWTRDLEGRTDISKHIIFISCRYELKNFWKKVFT